MVLSALVLGAAAAVPADLTEVRWTVVERGPDGITEAPGDRPWRMRCAGPTRVAVVEGGRVTGPFSAPTDTDSDGTWHRFAPGPAFARWAIPDGCVLQVAAVTRTSRGFDRLEAQAPPLVWPARSAPTFGATAAGWLDAGGLDAYRALRPPVLTGEGTHLDRDGIVSGPARLVVSAVGSGPTCVEVADLRSCRVADPEARWWLTLPAGRHAVQVTGAVQAELHWSRPPRADTPVAATVWPACATARDCDPRWDPVAPVGAPARAHRLESARGTERIAWWPVGHPALEDATWLEGGSLQLLVVPRGPDCALQLGTQTLHLFHPHARPVRTRLVWTGALRPDPPALSGCDGWVRAASEGDAWDARVLRAYHRVDPDRGLRFELDPAGPGVVWVMGGGGSVELVLDDVRWVLEPGPADTEAVEGHPVAAPVRLPLPPTSSLELAAAAGAWARVLQPSPDLGPAAARSGTLSASEVAPRVDRAALKELSMRIGSTPEDAGRAALLRRRASLADALGLPDDAAADRRWADHLDPGVSAERTDRWPAVAFALEGPDRWVPVDGRWLSVEATAPRADDPLAAAGLELPAAERVRLVLRAALDRQIPTAAERIAAFAALAEGPPDAMQAPALAPVRALSRWQGLESIDGARSEVRPLPTSQAARERLVWQDALFPGEGWDPGRTVSLSSGRALRLPAGEALRLPVRCRSRTLSPCVLEVRGAHPRRVVLDPLGDPAVLELPASDDGRYVHVVPARQRVAQVRLPEGLGDDLVAPNARWWWVQGTASATVVAPTVLRVRSDGPVRVAGVAVEGEGHVPIGGEGEVVVPLDADGAWVRIAFRVAQPTSLPVPLPPSPPVRTARAVEASVAPLAVRARPVGRPPVAVELGALGGGRAHPRLAAEGGQLDLDLGIRSRPLDLRWWNRLVLAQGLGPAGPVQELGLETVAAPLWGPRRLVLGMSGTGSAGPSDAGAVQAGRLQGWVQGGAWASRRWLLHGRATAFVRGASGEPTGADPRLWSPYAALHPAGLRGAARVRFVPGRWLDTELEATATTNAPGTTDLLDAVGVGLRVDGARPRTWGRLRLGWTRSLPDLDRDEARDRLTLGARGWLAGWVAGHAGWRWEVDAQARLGGRAWWFVGTGPRVVWSRDRGLRDVPPTALAHREAAAWTWDRSARDAVERR